VGHGARIPAAVPHGGRNLAHREVQPTVGATPNAVPHGGRKFPAAVGYGARCIFLEIFGSTIYFSKIKAKYV
jgi:hypothetical protein